MGDFAGILGLLAVVVWLLATLAAVVTCAVLLATVNFWFGMCVLLVYIGLAAWTGYAVSGAF